VLVRDSHSPHHWQMNTILVKVFGSIAGLLAVCSQVVLAQAPAAAADEWRTIDPANTLYVELDAGRVIIELAPQFAPKHVENIRTLVREKYFDAQRINRAQDNFVVQWGDESVARPLQKAKKTLTAEFTRSAVGLPFTLLPDGDVYAPQVGFSDGFPAARESEAGLAWATHCYATVGVGRDNGADSGGGTELYVVIGHAPRQLDRNITVVGRVVRGMPLLASLPRGTGDSGFYKQRSEHTIIRSIRLAADLPESEREPLEALRTDSKRFADQTESRRNRKDEWYKYQAGHIDICNVPLPVRTKK
jgi:peptidylprolyl isomerase